MTVASGMASLGLRPARNADDAAAALDLAGFAYLPIDALSPEIAHLLALRRLFGLRSPVNTVARLLDPARAPGGVDGVFHPQYIDVHLGVAERLSRPRLLVIKGGGGEAERAPQKAGVAFLWDNDRGRSEIALPPVRSSAAEYALSVPFDLSRIWRGESAPEREIAIIHATIALGILVCRGTIDAKAVLDDARSV